MEPILTVTDTPPPEAVAILSAGLNAHNVQHAGYADTTPLAVLVTDPASGALLGGITGRTSLGLAFFDMVYLDASVRGHGTGAQMLHRAEDEARRRGCKAAVLYTITFQAPGFYARHGWEEFGRVECDPPGTARVFFRKSLKPAEPCSAPPAPP